MRRIRGRAHTKTDDVQARVDTAWALGMRAGIDEGRQQAAREVNDREIRIAELEADRENLKSANKAQNNVNKRQAAKIVSLSKRVMASEDYAKRLERHLDPRSTSTTLLVKPDGTPFNETQNQKKVFAGSLHSRAAGYVTTETGRWASSGPIDSRGRQVNAIDFSQARPRGARFDCQTPSSVAEHATRTAEAAERATDPLAVIRANRGILVPEQSEEFVRRLAENPTIVGIDEAEGPDQTLIAETNGNGTAVRLLHPGEPYGADSLFDSLQDLASRALAQRRNAIMSDYGPDESEEEPGYDVADADAVGRVGVGNPVTAENAVEACRMLRELAYNGTSTRAQAVHFLQRREQIKRRFPEAFEDADEEEDEDDYPEPGEWYGR